MSRDAGQEMSDSAATAGQPQLRPRKGPSGRTLGPYLARTRGTLTAIVAALVAPLVAALVSMLQETFLESVLALSSTSSTDNSRQRRRRKGVACRRTGIQTTIDANKTPTAQSESTLPRNYDNLITMCANYVELLFFFRRLQFGHDSTAPNSSTGRLRPAPICSYLFLRPPFFAAAYRSHKPLPSSILSESSVCAFLLHLRQ